MRIGICVPEQHRTTGNWVTAGRFALGLSRHGHEVRLFSPPAEGEPWEEKQCGNPELVILIHAERCGRPWFAWAARPEIPALVFLSGTDVNEGLADRTQAPLIEEVMARSALLLMQNPLILADLRSRYPALSPRMLDLPAGTLAGSAAWDLRASASIADGLPIFLCPAGIRPVKAVLELLELFELLHRRHPGSFHLLFCGPCLDDAYGRRFLARLRRRPWAHWPGVIPREAMAGAMGQADLILNHSRSESLSNALIEAASLGRPMLARDIPGNRLIVRPGENGLLYRNEPEFLEAAEKLLLDPALRRTLSRKDEGRYGFEAEADALSAICLRFR